MYNNLKTLYHHRDLLLMWTVREIKLRYKQSFLGAAWAVLQPFSLMLIFTVVFSFFARVPTEGVPYPVFSYSALLPWTFLATSITFGVPSLVTNMNLVTKIYFPREVIPLASVIAAFVDFCVAFVLFLGMLISFGVGLHWTLLWLPVLLVVQGVLIVGVVLLGAAITVFYRDVRFVVPLGIQIWLYATPVIYPVSLVPEQLRFLYMLNPMAGLIESYRRVALHGVLPDFRYLGLATLVSLLLFLFSYHYFKRAERVFADVI